MRGRDDNDRREGGRDLCLNPISSLRGKERLACRRTVGVDWTLEAEEQRQQIVNQMVESTEVWTCLRGLECVGLVRFAKKGSGYFVILIQR